MDESGTLLHSLEGYQGRIEPPKAARGHATYIDGKMLSFTKINIEFKFGLYIYKHVNRRRVPGPLCGHFLYLRLRWLIFHL